MCDAVIGGLQLFIYGHRSKDDLMATSRVLSRIIIECRLEVFELIVELSDVTIVSKPSDVGRVEFEAFLAERRFRIV